MRAGIFQNRFVDELPGDTETRNYVRQVHQACYSPVRPTAVAQPQMLIHSPELTQQLGIEPAWMQDPEAAAILGGNQLLQGMQPYAMCYGGHQFGHWAGQLGDGRAINLGEMQAPGGQSWEIQLKGAGPTPYSRSADGRAVLRSSVREFLCSEAMFHLGIPTTRALSLVATGDRVMRDMFYDGRSAYEPGAIVCRVAPTFLRFGNYQLPASRQDHGLLQQLCDYTIRHFFPAIDPHDPDRYLHWFRVVGEATVATVVDWMRVGFVHGVMNTDNLSILGLTIDYGPYGWLEGYEPVWTPNTTDAQGRRYAYGQQVQIALWSLVRLAEAILPLSGDPEPYNQILQDLALAAEQQQQAMWLRKLGLQSDDTARSTVLLDDLHALLQATETDMTIFFRNLALVTDPGDWEPHLAAAWYKPEEITEELRDRYRDWLAAYLQFAADLGVDANTRRTTMDATNPKYVLRNYMAQLAIDEIQEKGTTAILHELLDVMRQPYAEQPQYQQWFARRPEWARDRAGCSMLSCSS